MKIDDNREDDKVKILSKKKLRALMPTGINSPDKADALMFTQFLAKRFGPAPAMDPKLRRYKHRSPLWTRPTSWKTI